LQFPLETSQRNGRRSWQRINFSWAALNYWKLLEINVRCCHGGKNLTPVFLYVRHSSFPLSTFIL
jgi:hypothetical protein